MTRPLLSVVVPVYNHEKFVAAALRSIIRQKWRPMELIVIDDGSRDASAAIAAEVLAAEMPDAIFIARENRGAHNTINQGLAMARGDVLTVLNSDDLFGPERLGRCMSIIAQQGIDFLFTDCGFIDRDGMPILGDPYVDSIRAAANRAELYPSLGFALLKNNLAVSTGNFMFSRRLWQLIGPFRSYRYVHDWDFILRALFHTEPFYLREPHYLYRIHGENTFSTLKALEGYETMEVMRNCMHRLVNRLPENRRAPSPHLWPGLFEWFVDKMHYAPYMPARWQTSVRR